MTARGAASPAIAAIASVVVASVALVVVLWSAGTLASNDGFAHLYNAFVLVHLDDPPWGFSRFLAPTPILTARGFETLFRMLEPAFGWRATYRVVVVSGPLLYATAVFALTTSRDLRRWPVGVLGFALALNHALYFGLVDFTLAAGLALWAIFVWRRFEGGVIRYPVVALLLFCAALSHIAAAALGGVVCFALTCARGPRFKDFVGVVVIGAPALAVAFAVFRTSDGSPTVSTPVLERVIDIVHFLPGPYWRGLGVWALAIGGAVSVVHAGRLREERALALCGVAFLAVALALPRDAFGWQLSSYRPLPFAAALLVAVLDVERARTRVTLHSVCVAFAVAALAWSAWFHARLAAVLDPVVDRVAALTPSPAVRGALVLAPLAPPALADLALPLWFPYQRLPQLSGISLGGVPAYSFVGNGNHHPLHLLAPTPPAPPAELVDTVPQAPPAARRDAIRRVAAMNAPLGSIVAFGDALDLAAVVDVGYVVDQRIDAPSADDLSVLAAHFVGCSARVHIDTDGDGGAGVSVTAGWWPIGDVHGTFHVVDGAVVDGLGCGDVWLTFGSGADRPCAEARDNRVRTTLAPDHVVDVACTRGHAASPIEAP